MRDPDSPTGPPPPPYPDVSNLTQASAERIRNRQHQEDRYASTNYLELNKFIDDNFISRYSERGKETVKRWKSDLLSLLRPFPYDPTFNFYTSEASAMVFAPKGEYAAAKVFKSLDQLISPQDKRYSEINSLLTEGNLLDEYEDRPTRDRAEQAVRCIMEYLYRHDWYLRHRDNWGKIWDKFEQLEHGIVELLDDHRQMYEVYEPENFIRSRGLIPDPNPPSKLSLIRGRRRPAHLDRSLEHHRITSRYALISGLRTSGPASYGGVRFCPF